ncbi:phosphotransferase family protein [Planosporangium mesophilum]|uniref:Homoserine kinase n=1 Tax=Planosporangium mesophilum TaxID=689768 RepID=A0A8J3TBK3_9ACTN|nr:phosphotransferase [Planosporangium mesophilum]NJC86689.1 phosphotransferase [Planosporangium mesophilum]GII24115.1 homoserine kinase [Planosporangium mesophilum]
MTDTADRIADWVSTNRYRLGLPAPAYPRVSLIGTGESYAAWLVRVPDADPLVVRIARRPVDQLPRPMAAELAGMALVPPGLGPRPVLLEESPVPLGAPFMVTGYVPGREVEPAGWTDELLVAHARQVAMLHAEPHRVHGDITTPVEQRSPVLSLTAKVADSIAWWREANPDVAGDPEVTALLPSVEAYVAATEPAFARLHRFALIHGDLVVPNVLVDDAGTPRYVDWEWAEVGDPAQDLAYLGGAVAAPPWYLPLPSERVDLLLRAYVEAAGDAAGPLDDLRVRRDAFEVYERFFSSLHFRTRRGGPEDLRSGRYTDAVRLLTDGLTARLS